MHAFGDQSHAAYEIIWVSFFTLRIQTFNVKVYNALWQFFSADFLRDMDFSAISQRKKGYNTVVMFVQKSWVKNPPTRQEFFFIVQWGWMKNWKPISLSPSISITLSG